MVRDARHAAPPDIGRSAAPICARRAAGCALTIFFEGWEPLRRVLIVAPLAYIALVLLLRISGKRTLTKLNAFDLVITVALGSTLATSVLSKQTTLAEGVLAFAVLIVLQFVGTWTSVRWSPVEDLVKSEPTLLLRQGKMLDHAMRTQRVTRQELLQALRASGHADPGEVAAVVLETDGSFSVLGQVSEPGEGALEDLPRIKTS